VRHSEISTSEASEHVGGDGDGERDDVPSCYGSVTS
jgi:hypothetical protein